MKRSLKKILRKQFGSAASQPRSLMAAAEWFQLQTTKKIVVTASALTAATLSLVTGRPAKALQIFPVDLSNYTPSSLNENILVTDTFGNSVPVTFSWTGNTGNFSTSGNNGLQFPQPSNLLTGGFAGGSILEIQHDPASLNESVSLDISFGAEVEQARLVVIDVDRDNANTWQDLVSVGGSVAPNAITPAFQPTPLLQVSPEVAAIVTGIPLGIDQPNGGAAPGLAPTSDFTVDIAGTEFVGVYNPRSLDGRLAGAATRTEFTPINASNTGGIAVNPVDPLPTNPAGAPSTGVEAQNQSPEGTITVDYSAVSGPLTNLTFNYGNGPASVADGLNPAGGAGYITSNDANGGPGNHGVGLYTIFLVPGSIGTAKSASAPVPVSATEFDVTYTVSVQNFGARTPLTNVQVTDNLVNTFGGATGFTVVTAPTLISGPATITGTANTAFNGNGDQNLLNGTGSLAPGERAVIQYTVRLDTTAANITPGTTYNNTAVGAADTPIGLRISDTSVDNSTPPTANLNPNPDPNGDGDPLETSPTPVVLPTVTVPNINVTEQVVSTELNPATGPAAVFPGNTARVLYRIRVQNTGAEQLTNVTLTNDFTDTFDNGTRGGSGPDNGFEIVSVTQVDGIANPVNANYNGGDSVDSGGVGAPTEDATLATGGTLAPNDFTEYEVLVDVDTTGNGETLTAALPGPFNNFTTATGVGSDPTTPSNLTVSDISNDATGANLGDPNILNPPGGSPTGGSSIAPTLPDPTDPENTPTPVTIQLTTEPRINVSEEVVSTTLNPAGGAFGANTGRVLYRIRVQNTGAEDLRDVTLINDFTDTFDNGTRGGSGPDNGFEIVTVRQLTGGGQTPNDFNPTYDGGDSDNSNDVGPANTDDNTLVSGGDLNVGQFSEYEIEVDVDLTDGGETLIAPLPGPFINSTLATGIGDDPVTPSNIPVNDRSNDRNSVTPVPPTLEGALNPDGGSPTGGGAVGTPGNPPADPGITDPENTPSPVTFPIQPQINVSEQVVTTVIEPTGTYGTNTGRVTYRIRVQNTGVEDLNSVTLTNDFTDTFDNGTRGGSGPDNGFEIVAVRQLPGNGANANTFNPNYDGGDSFENGTGPANTTPNGDATLLSGGSLVVGEFSEYEIDVDVDLTGNGATLITELPGPFLNATTATGIGNTSTIPVSDISNDLNSLSPVPADLGGALNPDGGSPTGGGTVGNPGDPVAPAPNPNDPENTPSPARLITTPEISVIERIDQSRTEVGAIAGSTFGTSNIRLVYQIVVRNIGIENLQNVDLINDFRPTFGTSGDDFTVVGSPTLVTAGGGVSTVPVNPNFNGSTDLLLAGDSASPASTLNVGEFAVYEIVVDVNTAGSNVASQLPGPFDNQTTTNGIGVISGEPTSDVSNDINPFPGGGTTPDFGASDPNGNLEANEVGENTPTPVILGADLRLVKRITRVTRGGTDLLLSGINNFTNQPNTSDDDTLANLAGNSLPLGVFDVPNPLQSGDIVEYTVYFFNAGVAQAANVEMCDELQVPSVLQPASLELASPTTLSALGTNLTFASGSPLLFPQAPLAALVESCESFPGAFPSGTPVGGLGVGAGGGVIAGGPTLGLNVNASEVGAFRFTVVIP